jgi:uncharacterized damage-inducible protein DinB
MAARGTLAELLHHNKWACDLLLGLAEALKDAALDRPFPMGPGSIRATLQHLWAAEQLWLERWKGAPQPQWRGSETGVPVGELRTRFQQTHDDRETFLAAAGAAGLGRRVAYRNLKGEPFEDPLGDLVLHVSNHGVHHRAQIANMLRHVGVKPPGLDYLYMRAAFPTLPPVRAAGLRARHHRRVLPLQRLGHRPRPGRGGAAFGRRA